MPAPPRYEPAKVPFDPVLERLLEEEEEIERRAAERVASGPSEALYRCDGCGHHGFTIKMCPRCSGTDTCAREES